MISGCEDFLHETRPALRTGAPGGRPRLAAPLPWRGATRQRRVQQCDQQCCHGVELGGHLPHAPARARVVGGAVFDEEVQFRCPSVLEPCGQAADVVIGAVLPGKGRLLPASRTRNVLAME
jgi:hypothetical protein